MKKKKNTSKSKYYHFTECGLDYIYLLDGFTITSTPYGKAVSISKADNLLKKIAETLVYSPFIFNAQEVRFFRSMLELSQHKLAKLCGVEDRTVRRWESGDVSIPLTVNFILRVFYIEKMKKTPAAQKIMDILEKAQKIENQRLEFEELQSGWKKAA